MPKVVPSLPDLPADVAKRFPSMKQWKAEADKGYRERFAMALGWPLE